MGMMSRRKGAAGELEAAAKMNEVLGTRFHRGRQYHGGPESPDLAGDVPGLHVEVKRTERLRLWEAVRQARADAGVDHVPVVMLRRPTPVSGVHWPRRVCRFIRKNLRTKGQPVRWKTCVAWGV
jgi:hypothetical protein